MSGPLDPEFFASVSDPGTVDAWLVAFADHVSTLRSPSLGGPDFKDPVLLVSTFLLTRVSDVPGVQGALASRGVTLRPYPGGDVDLVDLVDAAGYANLLYLPPPPYCSDPALVEAHNLSRWSGTPLPEYAPVAPDVDPELLSSFLTFLGDGLSPAAAWDAAEFFLS